MLNRPILALAATAIVLSAPARAQEGEPFIIGAAIAQTGFVTAFDQEPARAAELAVKEINEQGGVLGRPLQIIYADTKSDIAQGTVAAMELLRQDADMLIVTGDFDYGGMAARTAGSQGKIAIAPFAADPRFGPEGIGPYAFTFATATNTIGATLAEFAQKNGWQTAYTLTQTNVQYDLKVTEAFEARFEGINGPGSVVSRDTFSSDDASIAPHITRLRAMNPQPDVLLLSTHVPDGPSALRQLRAAGVDLPILSAEDMDGDYWLESVPDLSNFYYASVGSVFGDDPRPEVNDFIETFRAEYGTRPVVANVITGYSAVQALKLAAERAGSLEPDALKAELEKFDAEPLLVGETTFNETDHISFDRPSVIIGVTDGQHAVVDTVTPASVPGR